MSLAGMYARLRCLLRKSTNGVKHHGPCVGARRNEVEVAGAKHHVELCNTSRGTVAREKLAALRQRNDRIQLPAPDPHGRPEGHPVDGTPGVVTPGGFRNKA